MSYVFVSHRPIEANDGNFPFYLTIRPTNAGNIWYFPRPLGKNKLGEFLSKAAPFVNLENLHNKKSRSKVSNHSARKTSITNLLNSNIHPLHVSQLSGHKNIESLNSYHTASKSQQKRMSQVLSSSISSSANISEPLQKQIQPLSNEITIPSNKSFSLDSNKVRSVPYLAVVIFQTVRSK